MLLFLLQLTLATACFISAKQISIEQNKEIEPKGRDNLQIQSFVENLVESD
jgi:hypothetical protein